MEPGALLFVTLVAIVGFGLLWFRVQEFRGKQPQLPDMWSVKPSLEQRFEIMSRTPEPEHRSELPANPQSNAVDRPAEPPQTGPEPRAVLDTEPGWIEVTREELIESLALVVVLEPDGTKRKLSQDMISKSAAMSKEATAALMRKARCEPDPEVKPSGPQFKQIDGKQQFIRTDIKPLR